MSSAFTFMQKDEFAETSRFCLMFDKFFDCLNTRRAGEGKEKRKPDLEPYWSVNDVRFTVGFLIVANRQSLLKVYCLQVARGNFSGLPQGMEGVSKWKR